MKGNTRSLNILFAVLAVALVLALIPGCTPAIGPDGNGTDGDTTTDDTGEPANQAPTAVVTASADSVIFGGKVTLDASGSTDPDEDALTYSWQLVVPSGSTAALSDAAAEKPTFTTDLLGDYVAILTVDDGNGGSDFALVTVEAIPENITEVTADITENTTWRTDTIYEVSGTISVSGATLTIPAGATVRFTAGSGLSVDGDAAALIADGEAGNPITLTGTQPNVGFWRGVLFDSANAQNLLDYVVVEYGGSEKWIVTTAAASVALDSAARATISNCTIRDGGGYGLYAEASSDLTGFSSNTITANDTPASLYTTLLGYLDSVSTYSGNTNDFVYVQDAVVGSDTTIPAIDVPYRLDGTHDIDGGSVSIAAGATLEFAAGSGLSVTNDNASLVVVGEDGNPVTLTGAQTNPGFWRGLLFDSANASNELSYAIVEYAGSDSWTVTASSANVAVDSNAFATISNCTIRDGDGYGLYAEASSDLTGFSSNTITANDTPASLYTTLLGYLDSVSTYSGNTNDFVYVQDAVVGSDTTIPAIDVPYRLDGTHDIDGGSVSIAAGATLEFKADSGLSVTNNNASIVAVGTDTAPITFTGTQASAGHWRGLLFDSSNALNRLEYVVVEFGGSDTWGVASELANVYVDSGATLTLENSTLQHSAGWGGYAEGGAGDISFNSNSYLDNAGGSNNYGE